MVVSVSSLLGGPCAGLGAVHHAISYIVRPGAPNELYSPLGALIDEIAQNSSG